MSAIQFKSQRQPKSVFLRVVLACAILFSLGIAAVAAGKLVKVSSDPFSNAASEHKTEVEPDTYAHGSTIVSTFQVARVFGGGAADIGFATSTNAGSTWTHGNLPGLTVNFKGGKFASASDPSVIYDVKHGVWLILSLPIDNQGRVDVAVSSSPDGLNWGNPVIVDNSGVDDKSWITCDTTSTSPFYGNCYAEWDQGFSTGDVEMSTSTDGGLTWGPSLRTADKLAGLGGQPVVQPNGTVVVPISSDFGGIASFTSTNGGASWNRSVQISGQQYHFQNGDLRSPALPSAAVDGSGTVYVVWGDCRFRKSCSSDDIVMSTSTDGNTWSTVTRIPIDATTSTVDHFIPGLGVDTNTSGTSAHLAMTYYFYPVSSCSSNCQLEVGFTTSNDGGQTWTAGTTLAGPMQLSWIAPSDNGQMVADYLAVSFSNGNPFGIFAVAGPPSGSTLNEVMVTTTAPLVAAADTPRFSSADEEPVHHLGNYVRPFLDDEGRTPNPAAGQFAHPPND